MKSFFYLYRFYRDCGHRRIAAAKRAWRIFIKPTF